MNIGIKDYCKYEEINIEDIANVLINLNKTYKNIHINIPLYQSNGPSPISLSMLYTLTEKNRGNNLGKGMFLNYYRCIVADPLDFGNGISGISVREADGALMNYCNSLDNPNIYTNKEVNSYIEYNGGQFKIIDKYGNIYLYYSKSNYPSKIMLKNGDEYNFSLSLDNNVENTRVNSINNQKGETVFFTYIDNKISDMTIYRADVLINTINVYYDTNGFVQELKYTNSNNKSISNYFTFNTSSQEIVVIPGISDYRYSIKYQDVNFNNIIVKSGYGDSYEGGLVNKYTYYNSYTTIENNRNQVSTYRFRKDNLLSYIIDHDKKIITYSYDENKKLTNVSNPTLQTEQFANENNKIINGYFQNSLYPNWIIEANSGSAIITNDDICPVNNKSLAILNINDTESSSISQTISMNGNANDNLSLIVWNGLTNPVMSESNSAQISIELFNKGIRTCNKVQELINDPEVQSGVWNCNILGVSTKTTYDEVKVTLKVTGNGHSYKFSAVQLYLKSFGATFSYDDSGNVISSCINNNNIQRCYSEGTNTLEQSISSDSSIQNDLRDSKGRLIYAETMDSVVIKNDYNSNNKLTRQRIICGSKYIQNNASYDENDGSIPANLYKDTVTDNNTNTSQYLYLKAERRLSEYIDSSNVQNKYTYNDWNNAIKYLVTKDDKSNEIDYEYYDDLNNSKLQGLPKTVKLKNGMKYHYYYDSIGRFIELRVSNTNIDNCSENLVTKYTYDDIDNNKLVYSNKIKSKYYSNSIKYTFEYNSKDEVTKVLYTYGDINSPTSVYVCEYEYDNQNRIKKVFNLRNNPVTYIEITYNLNNEITMIEEKEQTSNTILNKTQYEHDHLGVVISKKIGVNDDVKAFSYDSKNRSNSDKTINFYEGYKLQSGLVYKYSCFFNEKQLENGLIKSRLDANIKHINQKGRLTYDSVPAVYSENIIPFKTGNLSYVDYSFNHQRLSYLINTPLDYSNTVMFWFKPAQTNLDGMVLFSAGITKLIDQEYKNVSYIKVKINSNDQLVLSITDEEGVEVNNVITTTNSINFNQWNFFSIRWTNRNDGAAYPVHSLYEIGLNGVTQADYDNHYLLPVNDYLINIGCSRIQELPTSKFFGQITSLVFTNSITLSKDDVMDFYNQSKVYLFNNKYFDESLKTYSSSGTTKYNILSNTDLIPLNNSVKSIKNNLMPCDMTIRQSMGFNKDKSYDYDSAIKRYAYIADGAKLVYDFGFNSSGTIAFKAKINSSSLNQYFFENKDTSGRTLGLYRSVVNNRLYIDINGYSHYTGATYTSNNWTFIGLSWKLLTGTNPELGNMYEFLVMVGDNYVTKQIPIGFTYLPSTTSIGRKHDSKTLSVVIDNEVKSISTCYPLMGKIEMLNYNSNSLLLNDMVSIKNSCNAETFSKHYDEFDLIKKKQITKGNINILSHNYTYKTDENDSDRIIPQILMEQTVAGLSTVNNTYQYDNRGNITKIYENDECIKEYTYDYLNRLVKEKNVSNYIVYDYDDNGNILTKKTYLNSSDILISTDEFKYNRYQTLNQYPDRLMHYNNKEIMYSNDAIGNPEFYGITAIDQGIYFNWEGRSLTRYYDNTINKEILYKYNDQGLRVKKINGSLSTSYFYEGGNLIKETTNGVSKHYLYDEANMLYGIIYNGNTYYYIRDIMLNIKGLVDSNGNIVIQYTYDAYGNISTSGTLASTLGIDNPFRYKGYYYDEETKLYYCKSRYYNPEWGRWISPDSIDYLNPESVNGLNLYCYCGSNPINKHDPTGHSFKSFWENVGNWFFNTFGTYVDKSYDVINTGDSFDFFFGGFEVGEYISKIVGDDSKPISVFVATSSDWWKFWEYQVGLKVNIGKFIYSQSAGVGESNHSFGWGNKSLDIQVGINKIGIGTSQTVDGATTYSQTYIRTIPTLGLVFVGIYAGGYVIPFLKELSKSIIPSLPII